MAAAVSGTGGPSPGSRSEFCGTGIQHTGPGNFNVGRDVYIGVPDQSDRDFRFLADLRVTDPRHDKKRIQGTKGDLLQDSYSWILDHKDFRRWRDDEQSCLLWIRGDPGKGKTMLLCGIITELEKTPTGLPRPAYFFCQATEERLNNATAVLCGLLYILFEQHPALISHVPEQYKRAGQRLFEDHNAWTAISDILAKVLADPVVKGSILIIDALDECLRDLPPLLKFISTTPSCAKWLVSSRNWPVIEEALDRPEHKITIPLELNAESVAGAVHNYIKHKVKELAKVKRYSSKTRNTVLRHLSRHAGDTFLWVALVCQQLNIVPESEVRNKVKTFPPGLDALYQRMMQQISDSTISEKCKQFLAIAAVVYRPLSLVEYGSIYNLSSDTESDDSEWEDGDSEDTSRDERQPDFEKSIHDLVGYCGSFLTIRADVVYFIHQSAKDFLLNEKFTAFNQVLPFGIAHQHHAIFSRSLDVLSSTLRRDIYKLRHPGSSIDNISPPDPDPLASLKYSSTHWVDHLEHSNPEDSLICVDLQDNNSVHTFLKRHYLYWLEAQSLLKGMPQAVVAIRKLQILVGSMETQLAELVQDAYRFLLSYKQCAESFPLQLYTAALLFSPTRSLIRQLFNVEAPTWITVLIEVDADWNACLQTLEGHGNCVRSVAFSPDGRQLASASDDKTVKLWDAATGQCQQTLEGHSGAVFSVAFSPDGRQLASASNDDTVKLWDAATGQCQRTLEGHSGTVFSVAFSPDGRQLASASMHSIWSVPFSPDGGHNTVKLWDAATGQCQQTLEGHRSSVRSVAFSPNGRQLASASDDETVKLWDAATGQCQWTLEGHSSTVFSVAFSPDGRQLASASDKTIKLWDAATGQCQQTLGGYSGSILSVAFSPDGRQLALASDDKTVKLWDAVTGQCQQTLEGHGDSVRSVAFSPDGQQLASASYDKTVKLWDAATGQCQRPLEGHRSSVSSVVFSPDGRQLASASDDKSVKLWDAATGQCQQTLEGHSSSIILVAFSPDGRQLASASRTYYSTIELWDAATGQRQQTLELARGRLNSVAFSPDGRQLVSASSYACEDYTDNTVKLWDAATGQCQETKDLCDASVLSVAFSPDGRQLASAHSYACEDYTDNTVELWDAATFQCQQTLVGHSGSVYSVAFSPDGRQLASASYDDTVKLWDAATGQCQQTLEGHTSLENVFATTTKEQNRGLNDQSHILSQHGMWIKNNSQNILWLPPEYRATCRAVNGSRIAVGCQSGRVLLLQVSLES